MNQKKARSLRKKAKELAIRWYREQILPPEGDYTDKEVWNAVVKLSYFMNNRSLFVSNLTKRWFIKKVKKAPGVTFEEIYDEIYNQV